MAEPAAWQRRLWRNSAAPCMAEQAHRLVTYSETTAAVPMLPANWVGLLNQSLQRGWHDVSAWRFHAVVVRRAVRQVFAALPEAPDASIVSTISSTVTGNGLPAESGWSPKIAPHGAVAAGGWPWRNNWNVCSALRHAAVSRRADGGRCYLSLEDLRTPS